MYIRIKRIILYILFFVLIISCSTYSSINGYSRQSSIKVPDVKALKLIRLNAVIPEYNLDYLEAFKNFQSYIDNLLPDYHVAFTIIKGDIYAYDTKLRILQSTNVVPDVFYSQGGTHIKQLLTSGNIVPINKYLDTLKFWDMVMPSSQVKGFGGHIYAVPIDDVSYEVMEYNSEIFKKNNIIMPTNFEDLKKVVLVLRSKNIIPIALGAKDGYPAAMMMEGFAYTVDPKITSNILSGLAKFSDNPYKMAAGKVKELIDIGAFQNDVQNVTGEAAAQLYYSGKAAMFCSSSKDFNISNIKLQGKSMLMYYPVLDTANSANYGKAAAGGVKSNSGLFLSSISKFPHEAIKLAIEMSKYNSTYLYENKNNPAIIYNEGELKLKLSDKTTLPLIRLMMNAYNFKSSTGFIQDVMPNDDVSNAVDEASTTFMTGLLNIDDYLKEMDATISSK